MVPPPPPAYVPSPAAGAGNGQPAAMPGLNNINELVTQILQGMQNGTIPAAQGLQVLNALSTAQNGGLPLPPPQPTTATQALPNVHDNNPQDRFEQNGNRYRDRSRSPDYNGRRRSPMRRSPPNRRESPTYGVYEPNGAQGGSMNRPDRSERGRGGRGRNRGGRNDGNEYRQRSPLQRRHSPGGNMPKFVDHDPTLPPDHIRVLSRTLFVGGAGGSESEIRAIFSRFGRVQTCIVAQEKRHAFVKMLTRPDAIAAKEGMDTISDAATLSKARQVRRKVLLIQLIDADRHRHDGALVSVLETAVTTIMASASFPLLD
jgi:protein NRD1